RHRDPLDAAEPGRGGESREVTDHTAAERDHDVLPSDLELIERRPQALELERTLRALPGRNRDQLGGDAGARQRSERTGAVESRRVRIRHQRGAARTGGPHDPAEPGETAALDPDAAHRRAGGIADDDVGHPGTIGEPRSRDAIDVIRSTGAGSPSGGPW